MLAWEFFVHKEDRENPGKDFGPILAAWRLSYEGIRWLEKLAKEGAIEDLGGDGYPRKFSAQVKNILPVLEAGFPPIHKRPEYIGSENRLPRSWNGKLMINKIEFNKCLDTDYLLIEAWDQS